MPVELHMESYPELIEQGLAHLIDNSCDMGLTAVITASSDYWPKCRTTAFD